MQIIFSFKKGYVTIFISLIFTIILSLLLILVEGTQIGATRLQARMVTELSVDSCFAEYSRDLWKDYHQLFIDTSYGEKKGSIYRLERHLSNYVEKNCKQDVPLTTSFTKLKNPYLEIDKYKLASDEYGKVWKEEAVHYMKDSYGIGAFEEISKVVTNGSAGDAFCMNTKSFGDNSNINVKDITRQKEEELQRKFDAEREARIAEKKAAYGDALTDEIARQIEESEPREIANLKDKRDAGVSMRELSDKWDEYRGKGILELISLNKCISQKKILRDGLLTSRIQKDNNMLSIADEIIFDEYLFEHFGNFLEVLDNKKLDYEMEYILSGHLSDEDNLRAFAEKLFTLRLGANYLYLSGDSGKQGEIDLLASAMAAAILAPEAKPVFKILIQSTWTFAESVSDLRIIFNQGRVPLVKKSGDWKISLHNAIKGITKSENTGNSSTGALDYKGYLRLFIFLERDNKAPRSMDLVEENLDIKMTDCVYEISVNLGYVDSKGHSYLINRIRNYE